MLAVTQSHQTKGENMRQQIAVITIFTILMTLGLGASAASPAPGTKPVVTQSTLSLDNLCKLVSLGHMKSERAQVLLDDDYERHGSYEIQLDELCEAS